MEKQQLIQLILSAIDEFDADAQSRQKAALERIQALEAEVERLEILLEKRSFLDELSDVELKKRLSELRRAPFDTQIREAGVVLENRLRSYIGDDAKGLTGSKLVDLAFQPKIGKFQVSDVPAEQAGVKNLYLGAVLFIRNPVMHRLIEYHEQTARILLKMIDSLLSLLDEIAGDNMKSLQKPILWTEDRLRQALTTGIDRTLAERCQKLLNLALENKRFAKSSGKLPLFGILNRSGKRVITVKFNGDMYFYLAPDRFEDSEERERVFEWYQEIGFIAPSENLDAIVDGRYSRRLISDLSDEEFNRYLDYIKTTFL